MSDTAGTEGPPEPPGPPKEEGPPPGAQESAPAGPPAEEPMQVTQAPEAAPQVKTEPEPEPMQVNDEPPRLPPATRPSLPPGMSPPSAGPPPVSMAGHPPVHQPPTSLGDPRTGQPPVRLPVSQSLIAQELSAPPKMPTGPIIRDHAPQFGQRMPVHLQMRPGGPRQLPPEAMRQLESQIQMRRMQRPRMSLENLPPGHPLRAQLGEGGHPRMPLDMNPRQLPPELARQLQEGQLPRQMSPGALQQRLALEQQQREMSPSALQQQRLQQQQQALEAHQRQLALENLQQQRQMSLENQQRQMSPGGLQQSRMSPGGPRQMSPGGLQQSRQMSPGGVRQMSPGAIQQSRQMSPGGPRQMSPGVPRQMSPGLPRQMSPGVPRQMSPGGPMHSPVPPGYADPSRMPPTSQADAEHGPGERPPFPERPSDQVPLPHERMMEGRVPLPHERMMMERMPNPDRVSMPHERVPLPHERMAMGERMHHERMPMHAERMPMHAERMPMHAERMPMHHERMPMHHERMPMHHERMPMHIERAQLGERMAMHMERMPMGERMQLHHERMQMPHDRMNGAERMPMQMHAERMRMQFPPGFQPGMERHRIPRPGMVGQPIRHDMMRMRWPQDIRMPGPRMRIPGPRMRMPVQRMPGQSPPRMFQHPSLAGMTRTPSPSSSPMGQGFGSPHQTSPRTPIPTPSPESLDRVDMTSPRGPGHPGLPPGHPALQGHPGQGHPPGQGHLPGQGHPPGQGLPPGHPGHQMDPMSQLYRTTQLARQQSAPAGVSTLTQLLRDTSPPSKNEDDEDVATFKLTPEQQKQLAFIDSMPLTMEKELSQETPEEREKILMERRLNYEMHHQEFEHQKKKKKKKKNKNKDKSKEKERVIEQVVEMEPMEPPKKRAKKLKQNGAMDYDFQFETMVQQLRQMPGLILLEPDIGPKSNVMPKFGTGNSKDNTQLFGDYGMARLPKSSSINQDVYSLPPFNHLPIDRQKPPPPKPMEMKTEHPSLDRQLSQADRSALAQQRPKTPTLPLPPMIEPRMPSRASSTPDSLVSCSSPECMASDRNPLYPELEVIKEEPQDIEIDDRPCSPTIPIVAPVAIKASYHDPKLETSWNNNNPREEKRFNEYIQSERENLMFENPYEKERLAKSLMSESMYGKEFKAVQQHQNKVSVTITLNVSAPDEVSRVIMALADLLQIPAPTGYEMTRDDTHTKNNQPDGSAKHKEELVNIHYYVKSKSMFCRSCMKVITGRPIRKKMKDLPFLAKDAKGWYEVDEYEVIFCTLACYINYCVTCRSISTGAPQPREHTLSGEEFMAKPKIGGPESPTIRRDGAISTIKLRRRSESVCSNMPKKWRGVRYRKWQPEFQPHIKHEPVSEKELDELRVNTILFPYPDQQDGRVCVLCQMHGDGNVDVQGRLLNLDMDRWIHLNCALWSTEVYETCNGALMNVEQAIVRGNGTKCFHCQRFGATVTCFKVKCIGIYHVGCAMRDGCMFFKDKTILCPQHAPKGGNDYELTSLSVFRKVYVNRDENKQLAGMIQEEDGSHTIRIGALTFHNIGQLLPHQLQSGHYHTKDAIYPIGFETSRFYWSMRHVNRRCMYGCSIVDTENGPEFIVKVMEDGYDEISYRDKSPKEVWTPILNEIEKKRREHQLVKMFPAFLTGEDMFGLSEPTIRRMIESLPGVELLKDYRFRYGRKELIELPLAINPTGCARSEPKFRTHFRKPHTLQSSSARSSLPTTISMLTGGQSEIDSPYMKQFVRSKSQQYRRLKTEWRNNVYLGRSRIQGLGLYAARDLEKHTMVIEYIGELIRNEVSEKRERQYIEANRGIYMFRIDEDTVVDATLAGGPARYVNHSCNPCCVAEVVQLGEESKIIIMTSRRIARGEELVYDYKFDLEDDQHKIPCMCGAGNCRKWMN